MNFLKKYIQNVIAEAKVIAWPKYERVYNDTLIVLFVTAALAIVIAGLDYGFTNAFLSIIGQ